MANATKYVDNVNGNNGNTGDSEAQAYADIPTALAAISGGGNTIYVQNAGSDYVLTSTIAFPTGLKGDSTDGRNRLIGYTTTPGASDGRPRITSSTNSVPLFTLNDTDYWNFDHLEFTHTAATRGTAITGGAGGNSSGCIFNDLLIDGCIQGIANGSSAILSSIIKFSEIRNCTGSTVGAVNFLGVLFANYIHDNAGDGASGSFAPVMILFNIFDNNGRDGVSDTTGSGSNISTFLIIGNVFYNNGRDGIRSTGDVSASLFVGPIVNNIFYSNAGYGQNWVNLSSGEANVFPVFSDKNAYGDNTSGSIANLLAGANDITLSADPFTDAVNGDFSPNNTAGGGALCRAAGFPGEFPSGLTTSYADIGAAQHQDSVITYVTRWVGVRR